MAVQLLDQADGYGIIIGLSVLFCVIIIAAVRIQKKYLSEDSDQSEMFMVANRSVGTGLTASAVFSSWYANSPRLAATESRSANMASQDVD
jgi:Na+/proline symporter